MEYRDNYIYWILDFDIPFTNNLSERNLRGIKSKMKVSGQFQNINSAEDYANIRSYIETCRIYGKNEVDCLTRLVEGNPYTFQELKSQKNK
jgi:transposase